MPTQQSTPGYAAQRSVTPRRVLAQAGKDREIRVAVTLDKTASYDAGQSSGYEKYIRGGCFLAYSGGYYAPVKRTKASAAGSSTATLAVDNATHFRPGDSVIVGGNAAQAIVSVDSTTQITLTSAISWADNEQVYVAAWGTAVGVLLDDEVVLYNYDKSAVAYQSGQMAIAGYLDQDKLLGDVAAILEHPESNWNLRNFTIDDYQLGIDAEPKPLGFLGFSKFRYISGNYTITAADTGTFFLVNAAATLTLPTKAAGLFYGVMNIADNTVAIASASSADDIIADGDVAADSITFSTSSHKVGGFALITIAPDLTKWLALHVGAHVGTVA